MLAWAEAEAVLIRPPKGDKTPLKQHLAKVYEATGKKPKQLQEQPAKPRELDYLLGWFYRLYDPEKKRIPYAEISHWSELTGVNVRSWEVEVMQRLSVVFSSG